MKQRHMLSQISLTVHRLCMKQRYVWWFIVPVRSEEEVFSLSTYLLVHSAK